jgi:hypothetical protein
MLSIGPRASLSRHHVLALSMVVLAVTVGCTSFGESSATVTVENSEATPYRMSVYVFTEPVGVGNVTFQVTNSTGTRKEIGHLQLEDEGPYYNLSLGQKWNATERQISVPANETTMTSVTAWGPGKPILYVFERLDGRVVRNDWAECSADSLSHTFVFSDGPENGYRASCS